MPGDFELVKRQIDKIRDDETLTMEERGRRLNEIRDYLDFLLLDFSAEVTPSPRHPAN